MITWQKAIFSIAVLSSLFLTACSGSSGSSASTNPILKSMAWKGVCVENGGTSWRHYIQVKDNVVTYTGLDWSGNTTCNGNPSSGWTSDEDFSVGKVMKRSPWTQQFNMSACGMGTQLYYSTLKIEGQTLMFAERNADHGGNREEERAIDFNANSDTFTAINVSEIPSLPDPSFTSNFCLH